MNKKIMTMMSATLMSCVLAGGVFASEQTFSSIDELTLKGVSNFRIEKAETASVTIAGDENDVTMENEAGYLYIEADSPVELVIRTPELDSLVLAGKSAGTMAGTFETDSLSLSLTGASTLDIEGTVKARAIKVNAGHRSVLEGTVDAEILVFSSSSSSDVILKGDVRDLNAKLYSGHLNFNGLNVQSAAITASGRADVEAIFPGNSDVKVIAKDNSSIALDMNGLLSARAMGDASIKYSGNIEWIGKYQSNTDDDDASIRKM